jgi:predicted nucleic acid-binding Zn ribbon protein
MERKCLDCGEPLRGRSDQKFCSDQCRNNYNNKINRAETNFMRNVQNILRRNRRILAELNPEGQRKVHQDLLIAKGFNFEFHTNTIQTNEGETYYFCYDQGLSLVEDHYYSLLKKKPDHEEPAFSL